MQTHNPDEFLKRWKIWDILRNTGAGAQLSCARTEAAMETEIIVYDGGAPEMVPT